MAEQTADSTSQDKFGPTYDSLKAVAAYSRGVERTALWSLIVAGVAMFVVFFIVNAGRESVPIVPDRGSVGFQGLIASILISLILTPYAYVRSTEFRNRSLPDAMRNKYTWFVIPVTIAITLFLALVTGAFFEMITRSFEGLELSRLSASLRLASTMAVLAYILVSWVMRMRNSNLIYIAVFYLFATLLISGAMHENPLWYQASFSYLGMTESNSKFLFDIGLPFTGLLIIIWSFYFKEYLNILLEDGIITQRTRSLLHWGIVLSAVLLSMVGLVRFGMAPIFNVVHDASATGMGVVLGLMMLFMPWMIKTFSRVFYIYSYVSVAMMVVAVVLMVMGVYSLTGLEMSAFVMASVWLLIFYRNVDQLVIQQRPYLHI